MHRKNRKITLNLWSFHPHLRLDICLTGIMIKILLLIDLSSGYDRKLLQGLVRYSKENGPWVFYRMDPPSAWTPEEEGRIIEWARKWQANAIIGRWRGSDISLLQQLEIPVVLQNNASRSNVFSNITGDYIGTGSLAADFFIKKRLRHFAFFGHRNTVWSTERMQGFTRHLTNLGYTDVSTYECGQPFDEVRSSVIKWLESLPKPVGLYCCDDANALNIAELCKLGNIAIPNEISLLGTDNDELLCDISDPPISSIGLNIEKGGWQTGKMIHQRILEHSTEPFSVSIYPTQIFQRASTNRYNVNDHFVKEIVDFIDSNFHNDIGVDDMLPLVPLSRRSLEVKFKKEMGTTLYQYMLNCRIEHFANLLLTTDKSLSEIAAESGFVDNGNISRIFRKFKGCPPAEFRQKHKAD